MAKYNREAEEQVLASLITVFRNHGFEGASLNRFTESTGLIKASLYHRFPEGKEQMAIAALTESARIFVEYTLAPIRLTDETPQQRLRQVTKRLDEFYSDGTQSCLIEKMSAADAPPAVRACVKDMLEFWIAEFAFLSRESGIKTRDARIRAEESVTAIQGALIISRALDNTREFKRTLASLATRLLAD